MGTNFSNFRSGINITPRSSSGAPADLVNNGDIAVDSNGVIYIKNSFGSQSLACKDSSDNLVVRDAKSLILYDSDNSNYIAIKAPGTTGGNYTFTLPNGYGSNGQVLTSDGSGGLSWSSSSVGGSGTANQLTYWTAASTLGTISAGTSGQVLVSNGAGVAPSWSTGGTNGQVLTTNGSGILSWSTPSIGRSSNIYENFIINSGMQINQRLKTSNLQSAIFNDYFLDRFHAWFESSPNSFTVSQGSVENSTLIPSTKTLKITASNTGGFTTLAIGYKIEALDAVKLYNQIISLSFVLKTYTNNFSIKVKLYAGTSSNIFTQHPVYSPDTDNYFSMPLNGSASYADFTLVKIENITIPSIPTLGDIRNGVWIVILFNGVPAASGDIIEISSIQLNTGTTSLTFQPKSFSDELRLCQRYYEKSYNYVDRPGIASNGFIAWKGASSDAIALPIAYKVPKRISSGNLFTYDVAGNGGLGDSRLTCNLGNNRTCTINTSNSSEYGFFGGYSNVGSPITTFEFNYVCDAEL